MPTLSEVLEEERNRIKRYYLKAGWQKEYEEVTEVQYIEAERAAGFFPKPGCGPIATGGFSRGSVSGKVEYVEEADILLKDHMISVDHRFKSGKILTLRDYIEYLTQEESPLCELAKKIKDSPEQYRFFCSFGIFKKKGISLNHQVARTVAQRLDIVKI